MLALRFGQSPLFGIVVDLGVRLSSVFFFFALSFLDCEKAGIEIVM
jgi:hypothetical protein